MAMEKDEAASAIQRVIRNELDDCERAMTRGDIAAAKRELDDAITKLKRIARDLD